EPRSRARTRVVPARDAPPRRGPARRRAGGVRRGQAPPSRELDLQATGVAPRGGREVGWPGVLGGSESARRPPVLSAPRALSLVTEGRRAGRTPSGRLPLRLQAGQFGVGQP